MLKWVFTNTQDKTYTLTGRKAFFHRYADTSFRNKWTGFFAPPLKFLDYYAYRVKFKGFDIWLSPSNQEKVIVKPWNACHYFKLNGVNVSETTFVCNKLPVMLSILRVENKAEKNVGLEIDMEFGINIRHMYENWHERGYNIEFNPVRRCVIASNEDKTIVIGCGNPSQHIGIRFLQKGFYKEHQDHQRCYVPGYYTIKFDIEGKGIVDIPIIFSAHPISKTKAINNFDSAFDKWKEMIYYKVSSYENIMHDFKINTPEKSIDKAFSWAAINLLQLFTENEGTGFGIYAGLPWFANLWARDSFISSLALDNLGLFNEARALLANFAKKGLPSKIDYENLAYGFADTGALFVNAVYHNFRFTGNRKILELLKDVKVENITLVNDLIDHDAHTTWMDTLTRRYAIEIESLWANNFRLMGKEEIAKRMMKKIKMLYFNDHAYDSLVEENGLLKRSKDLTPNCLFALLALDIKNNKVLDWLEKDFMTQYGISSRSKLDEKFDPKGYHTGAVWGLLTGTGACVFFKYGRIDAGLNCLKAMAKDTEMWNIGSMSECVTADKGELIGCGMQAWSSAMFITAIDEYLFGIKPDIAKGVVKIEPKIPSKWDYMERYSKRMGHNKMDLIIKRTDFGYAIKIYFKFPPNLKVELALDNAREIVVNNSKFKGNRAFFRVKGENEITVFV
ncbi:MAG TPA: hypothetical protein ENG42_00865 [Candidatus Aenigmarchaeota archaeon]|nr:hypothetical protein [Candidatus Aenigmarchaeota archaeon]